MMIENKTLKLADKNTTTKEWKQLAETLRKQYRKLRTENEIDLNGEYEEESWTTYTAYLKLESICFKYDASQRRSLKMRKDLLEAVKYALTTNAKII